MLTIEQFTADKLILTEIGQFKTFYDGLGYPEGFNLENPPSMMYVYKGWYFIYQESCGLCVLEIANICHCGSLQELEIILLKWYNNECDEEPKKMRTMLPDNIDSVEEAKAFLRDLYGNGEAFDLYDNPVLVLDKSGDDSLFNPGEAAVMRSLIEKILGQPRFDAHNYLIELDGYKMEQ